MGDPSMTEFVKRGAKQLKKSARRAASPYRLSERLVVTGVRHGGPRSLTEQAIEWK